MRKKLLSLILTVAVAVGLCLPGFASVGAMAEPTGIRISATYITVYTGQSRQLSATLTPADAVTSLNWSSDNSTVASVSSDGTVTGNRTGEANITVRTSNGRAAVCHVVVKNEGATTAASKITVSMSKLTVRVDQTRLLYTIPYPVDSKEDVTWSTSNSNVAQVDSMGNVYGVGPGTCTITATTVSGGASATCEVTVPDSVLTKSKKDTDTTESKSNSGVLTSAVARSTVAATAAETKRGEVGYATFKDKSYVAPEVVSAAAYAATEAGRDIRLRFTTTDENGKTAGALIFDPQAGKDRTENLYTEILLQSSKISTTKSRFSKYFSNKTAVLQLSHTGSFGLSVSVAAKVDLTGFDTGDLRFYTYDTAANRYEPLAASGVFVDKNGFLHFSTAVGGVIVVSQGELRP